MLMRLCPLVAIPLVAIPLVTMLLVGGSVQVHRAATVQTYAAPCRLNLQPRCRSVRAACGEPTCIGQRAKNVNSREKARIYPDFDLGPNAKRPVRHLCSMHETRRPAFQRWRGKRRSKNLESYQVLGTLGRVDNTRSWI